MKFLQIFWTTWGNSMKFSGKMCFKIILKVQKNQGFTLSLEDTFFQKTTGGVKLTPPPHPVLLGLKVNRSSPVKGLLIKSSFYLSKDLRILEYLNKETVWLFWLRKIIILRYFFCNKWSLLIGLVFCAQIIVTYQKWYQNIAY